MERKWWTLIAVVAGIFMLLLDVTIVNVALPQIQTAFDASLSDLQWVIDAYALSLAVLLLTAGTLADKFGRRKLYATGTAVFTAGSLLCGFADSALQLSVFRALQGVGGSIMFATSLALLSATFHGKDRGVAFGALGATTGVALALGPVIGGALTSGVSWRWIFLVNVPVGLLTIFVTNAMVNESKDPEASSMDWPGLITLSSGLGALVYGLIEAGGGWTQTKVEVLLASGVALLLVFVMVEAMQKRPMLDLQLFKVPTFVGGLVAAAAISGSLIATFPFLVLYLQNGLHYSAFQTGLRLMVLTGAVFVAAGISGRLIDKVPVRALIGGGFVFVTIGLLLMRGITVTSSWTHLIPGLVLAGIGNGMINVPLASTAVGVVRPQRAGMASGVNATFRQVGTAAGVAALGAVFSSHVTSAQGPAGAVDGLNEILLISACVTAVAAACALLLIRKRDFVDAQAEEDELPKLDAVA